MASKSWQPSHEPPGRGKEGHPSQWYNIYNGNKGGLWGTTQKLCSKAEQRYNENEGFMHTWSTEDRWLHRLSNTCSKHELTQVHEQTLQNARKRRPLTDPLTPHKTSASQNTTGHEGMLTWENALARMRINSTDPQRNNYTFAGYREFALWERKDGCFCTFNDFNTFAQLSFPSLTQISTSFSQPCLSKTPIFLACELSEKEIRHYIFLPVTCYYAQYRMRSAILRNHLKLHLTAFNSYFSILGLLRAKRHEHTKKSHQGEGRPLGYQQVQPMSLNSD